MLSLIAVPLLGLTTPAITSLQADAHQQKSPVAHTARRSEYTTLIAAASQRKRAVSEHKLNLLAGQPVIPGAPSAPPAHADVGANYKELYEASEARRVAQMNLCDQCKTAEEALILALDDAKVKHTYAEANATVLTAATENHTNAEELWTKKREDFATGKGDLSVDHLTADSPGSEFDNVISKIEALAKLAAQETTLEGYMDANKTIMDTARTAYGVSAAGAVTADETATLKDSAREAACTGLVATPAPTPTPTAAPTPAPTAAPTPAGVKTASDSAVDGFAGWGGSTTLRSTCGGMGEILGGFHILGGGTYLAKTYTNLAPHTKLNVAISFAKIDSWDNEEARVYVDGTKRYGTGPIYYTHGSQMCGMGHNGWNEALVDINFTTDHTGSTANIKIDTSLDQAPNDESWGLKSITVTTQ